MPVWNIASPFKESTLNKLHAGDLVSISGIIYTARDAAHKRLVEVLKSNQPLPFDLREQTIYYMGPSPARPSQIIGSCGPTTSGRMDVFTTALLASGLRAIIGKGERSQEVYESIKKYHAVYFVTYGGAGALLAKTIHKADVIAYQELGAEAIMRLEVARFPAIVASDIHGINLFDEQITKYRCI
jgi:fumarate hydratase subunit beta